MLHSLIRHSGTAFHQQFYSLITAPPIRPPPLIYRPPAHSGSGGASAPRGRRRRFNLSLAGPFGVRAGVRGLAGLRASPGGGRAAAAFVWRGAGRAGRAQLRAGRRLQAGMRRAVSGWLAISGSCHGRLHYLLMARIGVFNFGFHRQFYARIFCRARRPPAAINIRDYFRFRGTIFHFQPFIFGAGHCRIGRAFLGWGWAAGRFRQPGPGAGPGSPGICIAWGRLRGLGTTARIGHRRARAWVIRPAPGLLGFRDHGPPVQPPLAREQPRRQHCRRAGLAGQVSLQAAFCRE